MVSNMAAESRNGEILGFLLLLHASRCKPRLALICSVGRREVHSCHNVSRVHVTTCDSFMYHLLPRVTSYLINFTNMSIFR